MPEFKQEFPHKKEIIEEAHRVNEQVDEYFENPKTRKDKTKDEVAHEIIKEMPSKPIGLRGLSKEEIGWLNNLREGGVKILTDGFLEITRWEREDGAIIKIRQKVDGINSAIRMQDHILEQYGLQKGKKSGEVEQLESIQEIIEKANRLLNHWKIAKPKEKEKIQQELADVILQLEYCRDEFKIKTKDQVEEVVTLRDSRERENPPALAARTISALNNLNKRLGEIQIIKPLIAMRREILVFERRRQESYIRRAANRVGMVLHHQVFSERADSNPERFIQDYEPEFLDQEIGRAIYNLEKVTVAPYKQLAEQVKFFLLQNVKKFLKSKRDIISNRNSIKDGLVDALNILNSDLSDLG